MPELEALRSELEPRGIHFVALALTDSADHAREAAAGIGLKMPQAWTQQETLGPNGLRSVPALLFVDANGQVLQAQSGRARAAEVRRGAEALVR